MVRIQNTGPITALLLALTLATSSLSGCCCPSEEQMAKMKEEREARLAAKKKDIRDYYDTLDKIRKALPKTSKLEEKACKAEAIQKAKKDAPLGDRLLTIDLETLDFLTAESFDPERKKELAAWEWIRSREVKNLRHLDDIEDETIAGFVTDDIEKARKQPLFGVVVAESRAMPVIPEGTDDFTRGHYDGWIVVVDAKKGKALCQAPFSATNSETIEYKKGRIMGDQYNAEEAARDDFLENFEEATNASLARVAKGLRVNLGMFQL